MAKRTVNIGSTANDGTGDQLRTAFDKLNQNNDEIYGANFVTEDMLNDNIVGADELKVTGDGAAGQILTSNADGTFSWATGVTGDITGVEAGDGLTGGGTGGDVTLNVVGGTGITVAADSVSLATTVQDEITVNTNKTGITAAQAAEIVVNNAKVSDQTVVLNQGANVTITGTYPSFTIESADVTGAVASVNGAVDVVVLDTADIAENTNLYYTEARVAANSAVALNTAKVVITSAQAAEIAANTLKEGITTAQAADILVNNNKFTDQTVTLTDAGNITIGGTYPDFTIASADVVGAVTSVNGATAVVVLNTDDVTQGTTNLYNVNHTGDVNDASGVLTIKDDVVTAAKLDVSNTGANGQVLQYNTDGTMTWVTGVTGDVTAVAAGAGLTGGGTGGDLTLTVGAGDGITVAADTVSLAAGVAGDGLTLASGVLSVDTIGTGDIADNAITSPKLALFVDDLAATDTHILIANGTDFDNKPMSGDATMANTGAITIANNAITTDKILNDAVDADKLAPAINTLISDNTDKTGITAQQITDIGINNGKFTNATHTGEVTGSAGSDALTIANGAVVADRLATDAVTTVKILDANVTTAKILDDNVTHDKLEDRYTAVVSVTPAATYTLDWSTGAVFVMSADISQNIEFDFTNYKAGQTIDIYKLKGAYSITFDSDAATSETFNKCGGVDYAGASTNLIQVQCVDDSADAVFNYAVSAYVGDTTPS